jgi:ABC-type transporter Mla subunit MlaD
VVTGLEAALADALRQLDPTSATGARLIQAARDKLLEQMDEFSRCASARAARLAAFRDNEAIAATVRELYEAASEVTAASDGGMASASASDGTAGGFDGSVQRTAGGADGAQRTGRTARAALSSSICTSRCFARATSRRA